MKRSKENSHQPLQGTELHRLHPFLQASRDLLDPGFRLLDLQFLALGLLPDASLFEIQIQLHRGLGAGDFIADARIEFRDVVGETLVGCGRGGCFVGVLGQELGAEFSEVDFLGVGAAVGVYEIGMSVITIG